MEKEVSLELKERQTVSSKVAGGVTVGRIRVISGAVLEQDAEDKTNERRPRESLQGRYCQKMGKLGHPIQPV